jgi:molybdate transport system ATP-binding protein
MSLVVRTKWQRANFCLEVATELPSQGITALFGRSGSGKSSLLRLIAGLEQVSGSYVQFRQQIWQQANKFVPISKRKIGLVFQQPSLLPHLSVQQNLLYGFNRAPVNERRMHPTQIIELLELAPLIGLPIGALSGGQKQRLAIARAVLADPQLLLLDEPFAALDSHSKATILPFIRELASHTQIPVLLVSHDSKEVEKLADQVVFLKNGAIEKRLELTQALADPESPLFDGSDVTSIIEGTLGETDVWGRIPLIGFGCTMWLNELPTKNAKINQKFRLIIRAKDVSIALNNIIDISVQNQLPANISAIIPYRHQFLIQMQLINGQLLQAEITQYAAHKLNLQIGMRVIALVKAMAIG